MTLFVTHFSITFFFIFKELTALPTYTHKYTLYKEINIFSVPISFLNKLTYRKHLHFAVSVTLFNLDVQRWAQMCSTIKGRFVRHNLNISPQGIF